MEISDFPLLSTSKIVYLDNSATTQKPQVVIDAITRFYSSQNANVHRGIYSLSETATKLYDKSREKVARFIGASSSEVVFTSGTTQSLNMIAWMLELNEGDEIVLTEMEHHSNLIPWQQVAWQRKCVLRFIPVKDDYTLDMEKAKEIIGEKTKVVSLVHMSNVLGTINPVKEIAAMAHDVGAVVVVDGAQSVPHMSIDVKELDIDFLAFSAHKMCGPTGIGALYGKKELLKKLNPVVYGGGMVEEVTFENATWRDLPEKFEAGTPNIAGAIGFGAAVDYLNEVGMNRIEEKGNALTEYAFNKLSKIEGVTIIGPKENRGPVISFVIDGVHPHDVAQILSEANIAVRGGHHCAMPLMKKLGVNGTTRASFYLYNTISDVDMLIKGIKKVKEIFK